MADSEPQVRRESCIESMERVTNVFESQFLSKAVATGDPWSDHIIKDLNRFATSVQVDLWQTCGSMGAFCKGKGTR